MPPPSTFRSPFRSTWAISLLTYGARLLYWSVWFVLLPALVALFCFWMIPTQEGVCEGVWCAVSTFVKDQPVPVWILLFTGCEGLLWTMRYHLPGARQVYPFLRDGLSASQRLAIEQAYLLLEGVEALRRKHRVAIAATFSNKEKEMVQEAYDRLKEQVHQVPCNEEKLIEAFAVLRYHAEGSLSTWRKTPIREYTESIVGAVLLALCVRGFVLEAYKIPSGSMIPTLHVGDHIFVNKFVYGPHIPWTNSFLWENMPPRRGDVMVFAFPEDPSQDFIKRVIALPGDTLEIRSGHPWINGWEVPFCDVGPYRYRDEVHQGLHEGELFVEFLETSAYFVFHDRAVTMPVHQGPYVMPERELFGLGDNRNNSRDSRSWGSIPYSHIRGKAFFVWLSIAGHQIDWFRFGMGFQDRPRLPKVEQSLQDSLTRCLTERPSVEKATPPAP